MWSDQGIHLVFMSSVCLDGESLRIVSSRGDYEMLVSLLEQVQMDEHVIQTVIDRGLRFAAGYGHFDCVEFLLDWISQTELVSTNDILLIAMDEAMIGQNGLLLVKMVHRAIKAKLEYKLVKVKAEMLVQWAVEQGNFALVKYLLDDLKTLDPTEEQLRYLIHRGICAACEYDQSDTMASLIEEFTLLPIDFQKLDCLKLSEAFKNAAKNDCLDTACELLKFCAKKKVSVDHISFGVRKVLNAAAIRDRQEIVGSLLKTVKAMGADWRLVSDSRDCNIPATVKELFQRSRIPVAMRLIEQSLVLDPSSRDLVQMHFDGLISAAGDCQVEHFNTLWSSMIDHLRRSGDDPSFKMMIVTGVEQLMSVDWCDLDCMSSLVSKMLALEESIWIWMSALKSAIGSAVSKGQLPVVQFIMQTIDGLIADVGFFSKTKHLGLTDAMQDAISNGHVDVVEYLLSITKYDLSKLMELAVSNGRLNVLTVLMRKSAENQGLEVLELMSFVPLGLQAATERHDMVSLTSLFEFVDTHHGDCSAFANDICQCIAIALDADYPNGCGLVSAVAMEISATTKMLIDKAMSVDADRYRNFFSLQLSRFLDCDDLDMFKYAMEQLHQWNLSKEELLSDHLTYLWSYLKCAMQRGNADDVDYLLSLAHLATGRVYIIPLFDCITMAVDRNDRDMLQKLFTVAKNVNCLADDLRMRLFHLIHHTAATSCLENVKMVMRFTIQLGVKRKQMMYYFQTALKGSLQNDDPRIFEYLIDRAQVLKYVMEDWTRETSMQFAILASNHISLRRYIDWMTVMGATKFEHWNTNFNRAIENTHRSKECKMASEYLLNRALAMGGQIEQLKCGIMENFEFCAAPLDSYYCDVHHAEALMNILLTRRFEMHFMVEIIHHRVVEMDKFGNSELMLDAAIQLNVPFLAIEEGIRYAFRRLRSTKCCKTAVHLIRRSILLDGASLELLSEEITVALRCLLETGKENMFNSFVDFLVENRVTSILKRALQGVTGVIPVDMISCFLDKFLALGYQVADLDDSLGVRIAENLEICLFKEIQQLVDRLVESNATDQQLIKVVSDGITRSSVCASVEIARYWITVAIRLRIASGLLKESFTKATKTAVDQRNRILVPILATGYLHLMGSLRDLDQTLPIMHTLLSWK